MKRLFLSFFLATFALMADETIILVKYNSHEWRIKDVCGGVSSKCLVIGNEQFQIRQSLASAKEILVKRNLRRVDEKIFMEISFYTGTNGGTFLLPVNTRYFMYDNLVVHPGKKNIWISNTAPNIDVGITFFGNRSPKNSKSISIFAWIEDKSPIPQNCYSQNRIDVLRCVKPPVECAKNIQEFIDYKGPSYLSPLLTMKELSTCKNGCDCKFQLKTLQDDLCYNILGFNNGSTDYLKVLESCRRLFSFYHLHSLDGELKKTINDRLIDIESMISRQKQLFFENGVTAIP